MAFRIHGNDSGQTVEVEANSAAMRAVVRPERTGHYIKKMQTGTMAAGLVANSVIMSMRSTAPDTLCLIRSISISAGNLLAFTPGICSFRLFFYRLANIAQTTGQVAQLAHPNGKKNSNHPATRLGQARTHLGTVVSGGVISLASTGATAANWSAVDGDPIAAITTSVQGVTGELILPKTDLIYKPPGTYPLVLAEQEGIGIQATVPGTGTWTASVFFEWEEVPAYL